MLLAAAILLYLAVGVYASKDTEEWYVRVIMAVLWFPFLIVGIIFAAVAMLWYRDENN